jgi:L-amino acid N-acyltransferase YncA
MKRNIRMARKDDAPQILKIYQPFIMNTTITFEYDKISLGDFENRMEDIMSQFPWIVYEIDENIVGYAYSSPLFSRAAFSWDCQCSVYIDNSNQGMGIGSQLYDVLFDINKRQGYYNVYALITVPNPSSMYFHEKQGFIHNGTYEKTGYKFGKWHDLELMSKTIGDFTTKPTPIKSIRDLSFTYKI